MTNINHHVPTLETCRKLKDAGFPQESLFYWFENGDLPYLVYKKAIVFMEGAITAPISSEILLPLAVSEGDKWFYINISHSDSIIMKLGLWYVSYEYQENTLWCMEEKTVVEAKAKMYLHLKEKGLICE